MSRTLFGMHSSCSTSEQAWSTMSIVIWNWKKNTNQSIIEWIIQLQWLESFGYWWWGTSLSKGKQLSDCIKRIGGQQSSGNKDSVKWGGGQLTGKTAWEGWLLDKNSHSSKRPLKVLLNLKRKKRGQFSSNQISTKTFGATFLKSWPDSQKACRNVSAENFRLFLQIKQHLKITVKLFTHKKPTSLSPQVSS